MAITKQGIPAVVTITVLSSLLYANLVTTTAYAQISFEGEQLNQAYEDLQESERKLREIQETERNARTFDAEDQEEARQLWEQQHQESINEVERPLSQVKMALNMTREAVNETIAQNLSNPQVEAARAQDPQFNNFANIWQSCMNSLLMNIISGSSSNAWTTISPLQCTISFNDATNTWCGLDQYDPNKCTLSSQMTMKFSQFFGGFEYLQQQQRNLEARLAELNCITPDGHQC